VSVPPNENGPREDTTPREGRSDDQVAATATAALMITPSSDKVRRIRRRRKPPTAYASVFAPDARRNRWLITFLCPVCRFGHRALAATEDEANGLRPRAACGRRVEIHVARTYRGPVTGGAE
jgi:hypothetical protein